MCVYVCVYVCIVSVSVCVYVRVCCVANIKLSGMRAVMIKQDLQPTTRMMATCSVKYANRAVTNTLLHTCENQAPAPEIHNTHTRAHTHTHAQHTFHTCKHPPGRPLVHESRSSLSGALARLCVPCSRSRSLLCSFCGAAHQLLQWQHTHTHTHTRCNHCLARFKPRRVFTEQQIPIF